MESEEVRMKSGIRIRRWIIRIIVIVVGMIFFANHIVVRGGGSYCYYDTRHLPQVETALLLGTGKYFSKNRINPYYAYRVDAAIKLYKSGKIKKILISGASTVEGYNEPVEMARDLKSSGIPASAIIMDEKGSSTFDSVCRASELFQKDSLIIVSQPFHNERAVYIARRKGVEAWGFNAFNLSRGTGLRVAIRERFARVKAVWDVSVNC